MSKHSRLRISRPLIGMLGLTIAVGAGAVLYNAKKEHAALQSAVAGAVSLKAVDPSVLEVKSTPKAPKNADVAPPALVTQTPAPMLSATPVSFALNGAGSDGSKQTGGPTLSDPPPLSAKPIAIAAPVSPALPGDSGQIIADAKSKFTANQFLAARAELNEALLQGRLTSADQETARKTLSDINKIVIFTKKRFPDDSFMTVYQVKDGDRLSRIADHHNVTWEALCRINGMTDPRKLRSGKWIKIPNGPFHCVITKSAFRLDVYLGSPGEADSLFVMSLPVGLGKDNSTPTGAWIIQSGAKAHPATYYSPRGEGIIAADDPKNPLGGYWMGLEGVSGNAVSKESYGIHGTIEPDSIGKQASMGCIRLGHDDIALLYDLLVDGKSKVIVKD